MSKPQRPSRDQYRLFYSYASRWHDNDMYGHFNNAIYYEYFDSAVNQHLIEQGKLDIHEDDRLCLVVSSGCDYHAELSYPDRVEVGLRVAHLGNSSVRYEIAMFREGEQLAAADGFFVHVFVDRATRRPLAIEGEMREAISKLVMA